MYGNSVGVQALACSAAGTTLKRELQPGRLADLWTFRARFDLQFARNFGPLFSQYETGQDGIILKRAVETTDGHR